jgi:hypothetical protein
VPRPNPRPPDPPPQIHAHAHTHTPRSVLCGAVFGPPSAGKSTLVRALAVKGGRDAAGGLLSAAGAVAVAGGGGATAAAAAGGGWEGHEVKTLVLTEVASAATPDCLLADLSRWVARALEGRAAPCLPTAAPTALTFIAACLASLGEAVEAGQN